MKINYSFFALLTALILFLPCITHAEIINVPDDFETIQAAIEASEDGDVVLVAPGEYDENIEFLGKAITVTSHIHNDGDREFIENTIIDGGRRDCVVAFIGEEGRESILRGFTIRNGLQMYGGGIDCQNDSSPLLIDLLVTENEATYTGGGIYISLLSTPLIQRTRVTGNHAGDGGGITNFQRSIAELVDVVIDNNSATQRGGGLFCDYGGSLSLDHVAVFGNTAGGSGGGMYGYEYVDYSFNNVTFAGNRAREYPALSLRAGSIEISNVIVWDHPNPSIQIYGDGESVVGISYCDIEGGQDIITVVGDAAINWDDESNFSDDPSFVDPEAGDFHLHPDSPCIDSGDPDGAEDPDGTRADRGAFFYDQDDLVQDAPNISLRWEIGQDDNLINYNDYFAEVYQDGEYTIPLIIVNTGTEELEIENIVIDNEAFSAEPAQFSLQTRDNMVVSITFSPDEIAEFESIITITSNDPDQAETEINLTAVASTPPVIEVTPLRIDEELFTGEVTHHEITITNTGENDLNWRIERELISEPEPDNRQEGPRRDAGGDLIEEIETNFGSIRGITSDGELIWLASTGENNTGSLVAMDPVTHEIVRHIRWDNVTPRDLFRDGDVFWMTAYYDEHYLILIIDDHGNIIETMETPVELMIPLAFNGDNLIFTYSYEDLSFYVLQKDDFDLSVIAEIPGSEVSGLPRDISLGAMTWAGEHDDGHLWLVYRQFQNYYIAQVHISDNWEAEVVQIFDIQPTYYFSLWHDGRNLWTSGGDDRRFIHIVDDGIYEFPWFNTDIIIGSLGANEEQVVELTYDASALMGGEYRGNLHILSNDPDDSDIEVEISLVVNDAPDIELRWDFGYLANLIDYNQYFDEIRTGGEYRIPVMICNSGADILEVEAVEFDQDCFRAEPDHFTVDANDRFFMDVIFSPVVEGAVDAVMTVHSNDPDQGEVTVQLTASAEQAMMTLQMSEGWNLISINVMPGEEFFREGEDRGPDVVLMTEQLRVDADNHHIRLMKDEAGRFYMPDQNFNNIPFWNLTEGYMISVDADVEAVWQGELIPFDTDIPLERGWNIAAYFPTYDLDVSSPDFYGFSSIRDNLIIAKNGNGEFMSSPFGFSNMQPLTPGQGYQINVDADVVLNYPPRGDDNQHRANSIQTPGSVRSNNNMSVLLTDIAGVTDAEINQVSAWSMDDLQVGTGRIEADGRCGLCIWGDDQDTEAREGLAAGESFRLSLAGEQEKSGGDLTPVSFTQGKSLTYTADGLLVLSAKTDPATVEDYTLFTAWPNPFNSTVRISYYLPAEANVRLSVTDINGRLIETLLAADSQAAGKHTLIWNPEAVSSGIYFVSLANGKRSLRMKVVYLR